MHGFFSGWGGRKVCRLFSAVPTFNTCHTQIIPVLYPRLQDHLQREALRGSDSRRKVSIIKSRKQQHKLIRKRNTVYRKLYIVIYSKAINIFDHVLTLRGEFTKGFRALYFSKKNKKRASYFNQVLNLVLK